MALLVNAHLFLRGTVGKWDVIISNVLEEMDLVIYQGESRSQRVDRSITPALVEEATVPIEYIEKVEVLVGSEPVQISDLEV